MAKLNNQETIAAIATPLGVGGVGVVRVSGEGALNIFRHLFIPSNGSAFESHRMLLGWINDSGEKVDNVLACYMKAPKSYTGEDVVEFYCHGGIAVLQRVLGLALNAGAELAGRGEFTKRAFLNGKLDLPKAEAVLDLIQAQTAKGAGYAIRQLEGGLSEKINDLRDQLLSLLAELEAIIDFPEDVPDLNYKAFLGKLSKQKKKVAELLKTEEAGKVFRNGIATTIIGKPNVGKSSLLNRLLGEDRSIVTSIAGTTRDTIEEALNIKGLPFRLIDTAGIRHPKDKVEIFGIERTRKEAEAADLVLIVLDCSKKLGSEDELVLKMVQKKKGIVVLNKVDLGRKIKLKKYLTGFPVYEVSALTGMGIKQLISGIYKFVSGRINQAGKDAVMINARHKECLTRAGGSIDKAAESCENKMAPDFITIDLKDAVVALGEISGEVVSEEVINKIFDQFCVGK